MKQRYFHSLSSNGFHRVAYREWGRSHQSQTVICVHGLSRHGRDFDWLAKRLRQRWRVACPDMAGRGLSDWLINPEDYSYATYLNDMVALIARLGVDEVDWVGTSMGGLIGMMLAAQPGAPIRRLVINDVGPFLPKAALERIGSYVGEKRRFASLAEAEQYFRTVHAPFGALTDAQWRHFTRHSVRTGRQGGLELHYDPAIGKPFKGELSDISLWEVWQRVRCPVLVLRGQDSDLLSADTASRMVEEGADCLLVEVPNVGHAPALMDDHQISLVETWLSGTPLLTPSTVAP